MKTRIYKILLILTCMFYTHFTYAQAVIDDVVTGMRSGNMNAISKNFDNLVSVTIDNGHFTYSRTQTELILKDFFRKNPPQGLSVINNGVSEHNARFVICDLSTPGNKYYVYIQARQKENGAYSVQEIRLTHQ